MVATITHVDWWQEAIVPPNLMRRIYLTVDRAPVAQNNDPACPTAGGTAPCQSCSHSYSSLPMAMSTQFTRKMMNSEMLEMTRKMTVARVLQLAS